MLSRVRIKDYAVIEDIEIVFGPGLNILTGETGAGKSIIIDALACALGDRAGTDAVRSERPQAEIDAVFDIPDTKDALSVDSPYAAAEDGELVASRTLLASGKTKAWINGRPCTVGALRSAADELVELERERLLKGRKFDALEIVDGWNKSDIEPLRSVLGDVHSGVLSLRSELASLSGDGEALRRLDAARFELSEIEAADLRVGEEEELAQRRDVLANVEVIAEGAQSALAALGADDAGAKDTVSRARAALSEAAKFDHSFADIAARLDEIEHLLSEITESLRGAFEGLDRSPQGLDEVVSRIDLIARLKRKYAGDIADILAYAERLRAEIETLGDRDRRRAELESELAPREEELRELASQLTTARKKAARGLAREVKVQLQGLAFDRTDFGVNFESKPIDASGGDRCGFSISLNPGEPVMPLEDVASLGESSRIMLAVRCAFSKARQSPTVVFDEIDIGIGGMTAHAVARKLKELAERTQVVCVTHLPQVAQVADHHVKVDKSVRQNKTRVTVVRLDAAGRRQELKRMEGKARQEGARRAA